MCDHPVEQVRFLACTAADRFPGKWTCDACGTSFNFDPAGRTSIIYLDHPNPKQDKGVKRFAEGGKY